jgi:hypothetical protein
MPVAEKNPSVPFLLNFFFFFTATRRIRANAVPTIFLLVDLSYNCLTELKLSDVEMTPLVQVQGKGGAGGYKNDRC